MTAVEYVRARLAAGDDPNTIEGDIAAALGNEAKDWALSGDDIWREDTVCPKCGSELAGICGGPTVQSPWGAPCTDDKPILRSEYERRKLE